MRTAHDVIVVGAGPAGSAAAFFLAKQGVDVMVVDKAKFPRDKTCGDAVGPRALAMLDKIGVLKEVETAGKITNHIKFHAPNSKTIRLSTSPLKKFPKKIVIIPRYKLDKIINQAAIRAGAKSLAGIKILDIKNDQNGVTINGREKQGNIRYFAKVAIIATGANTKLLHKSGFINHQPKFIFAMRGYYENIANLNKDIQFFYNGITLPGYGWVFPTTESSANVGVGYFQARKSVKNAKTINQVYKKFIGSSFLKDLLAQANLVGKIKSYPLRIDFTSSTTSIKNILAIGEAAGLVNPLTGEGIDYSLESGQIAAEEIITSFSAHDYTFNNFQNRLHNKYKIQFTEFERIRTRFFGNRYALNTFFNGISKDKKLMSIFINSVMGSENPNKLIAPLNLWRYI